MLRFILNEQTVETDLPSGSTVLDLVRYNKRLTGTKVGCREGDCGACTVLIGDVENGKLIYRSVTSCLMPLGNAAGKHIVTIEGINLPDGKPGQHNLTPVQQAMVDTNGTQCGFCTIGFVVSLTGFVLEQKLKHYDEAIAAIDGNICRCTGYKSIERAAAILCKQMKNKPQEDQLPWLIENKFIPSYFSNIKDRLLELKKNSPATTLPSINNLIVGGGTDLIVQKHLQVKRSATDHILDKKELKGIRMNNNRCIIGAAVTVTDFARSELIQGFFPDLKKHIKLVSSTPIRNMASLGGNLVNASPIGDMTVFLLALDAGIVLCNGNNRREIKLKDFYKGYKQTDMAPDEFIESIIFIPPAQNAKFSFEKVCKRTHLDIASVNCACLMQFGDDGTITDIHLAAGGVAPFPKYLAQTGSFLKTKKPGAAVLQEAIAMINSEIAPISDARGTKEYKKLLLRQLFLAQFSNNEDLIKQTLSTV
jgi:xanthine dehydrogenase small subunit